MITIYPTPERKKLWEEFQKIAKREGKTASELFEQILAEYIKEHGEGNPVYSLDKWNENNFFVAYPAVAESWDKKLKNFSVNELIELGLHVARRNSELITELRNRKVLLDINSLIIASEMIKVYQDLMRRGPD